ncbi:aldose 1-epimerase family protein [Streptococcus massiliensis]|uniref:LacX n=1 Tax=Streptococcus massiliensis TaxID=313439 RepID=A0A380L0L0_9STRE|nr:aldose 1-epimerase family protein [Streptococcus massiliensis]SUN76927.1 LacX [Streptococcus massiliensis]
MALTLKNDQVKLEFATFGGALSSIKDADGVEYLWQGDATYWSGQAPVLFPICGSLRDNRATIVEKEMIMPRHGLVRKKEFELFKQADDYIIFRIQSDDDMYQQFPFEFELQIRYDLLKKGVRTTYTVKNLDAKTLPFCIGGHPGFNCPLLAGETYEDYYLEFEKDEKLTVPTSYPETGLLNLVERHELPIKGNVLDLSYDLFSQDVLTLDRLKSRSVKLLSRKHRKGLQVDFADFPYLVLWSTANHDPFIALEPWSGLSTDVHATNDFLDKPNVQKVVSGQERKLAFDINLL